MTVPNSHPDLRAILASLIRGEDVAFALHDWLMERGDDRAWHFKEGWASRWSSQFYRLGQALLHFNVFVCHTCTTLEALEAGESLPNCLECAGLGWSMLIDRYKVDCKVERWVEVFPPVRRPLVSPASAQTSGQ